MNTSTLPPPEKFDHLEKTPLMLLIEQRVGMSLEQYLAERLTHRGSQTLVAREIGVHVSTLTNWLRRLQLIQASG